jgi:hypothetical protein
MLVLHDDALIKQWMIQPELRWWLCEKFNGHFVGGHLHGGGFDVGGMSFLPDRWGKEGVQQNRYEGWFAGAGLTYGYHLILSNRISLEFSLGVGYIYFCYDKYLNYSIIKNPPKETNSYRMHYFGPTKAGISIVYMLY